MRKKKQSRCLFRLTGLLLIFSLLLGICSVGAFAEASSGQSETATTPFTQGTLNSNSFRIPAMARLNDGTIVAAADARWNFTFDGGGGDIVTARSFDNGATWEDVQLANYMDDNGNVYNGSSTAFIDPSLVSDGETVYMLCDLYPYGVALNGNKETLPDYVTGFNEQGNLLLAENGTTDYCYYLREDGQICDENGDQVEHYNVDEWFRIYRDGELISNLFYADSPFRVQRTNYLYLVSSDDGGASWSTPRLLTNVKDAGERACLVSPGRGIYKDGKIIYPIYSYSGSESGQYLGFIYSENQGENWTRVDSCLTEWSSESTVVALGDGTLRFFYRNGTGYLKYVDYSFADNNWRDPVNTGIPVNSNTELSACMLAKTVNNHEVIAVTCPTGPNGNGSTSSNGSYQSTGKLFLLQVNADAGQTLTKLSETALGPVATAQLSDPNYLAENGFFAYSCVLECDAGDLLVMYENNQYGWGAGSDKYYTITAKSVSVNLTFDAGESETITDTATGVSITSEDGTTLMGVSVAPATVTGLSGTYIAYDIRLNAGRYTEAADVTLPLTEELKQAENLCGFVVNDDGSIQKIEGTKSAAGDTYSFRAPHFSVLGVAEDNVNTGEEEHDFVMDFGLQMIITNKDFGDETLTFSKENVTFGETVYGTFEVVSDSEIKYTPNAIMQGVETLRVTNGSDAHTVRIYPATSVYYEEGFATYTGNWGDQISKGNGTQAAQKAGESTDEYGYDAKYAAEVTGPSNGSQATSSEKSDTATFTFVGTGVEIYANTTPESGWLMIMVSKEDGTVEKLYRVDTHMGATEHAATDFQTGDGYNVPVTAILDLSYGTHIVTITHLSAYDSDSKTYTVKDVALDGFRVFGTLQDMKNAVYVADLEDDPSYTEIRDYTIAQLLKAPDIDESLISDDINDQMYRQYSENLGSITECGAIILASGGAPQADDAGDLLNNGPKNEVYLKPGQSLVFSISTKREVQIGLKALNKAVSVNMSNHSEAVAITSSTDMFYTVAPKADSASEKTITVTNSGENENAILSITLLKVCDDPNLKIGSVQDIDFTQALIDLGLIEAPAEEEPAVPVNPFEDIREGAYYYGPVLWAVENAITAGKDATHFAPADSCTRAQAVTFLYRAAGEPAPTITTCDFADVSANAYYYKAVLWAVENGITAGKDATHFAPNETCTRAQIVTFLYRAAGQPAVAAADAAFTDVPANAYYRNAVLWAAENGITAGKDANHFAPADTCTRAQIVTFLYRTEN